MMSRLKESNQVLNDKNEVGVKRTGKCATRAGRERLTESTSSIGTSMETS